MPNQDNTVENNPEEKYFNNKEYNTLLVSGSEEANSGNLVTLLTDVRNKELKHELLVKLKENNALGLLVDSIKNTPSLEKLKILVAACWESGINCSVQLPLFIDLALSSDFGLSLEAVTVIESMDGPFNMEHLNKGLEKVNSAKNITKEREPFMADLRERLEQFKHMTTG